jgi:hypothetical protein
VHCSICYCPYICPLVSSQKGGRVHVKDKIIRNSVFQLGSGPRNVVDADEEGDGCITRLVVIVLAGDGAQMEFAWPNCGHFVDTTSRDGPCIQLSG